MGATYMECSSREMTGVEEIFNKAICIAVGEDDRKTAENVAPSRSGGVTSKRKKNRSCKIL